MEVALVALQRLRQRRRRLLREMYGDNWNLYYPSPARALLGRRSYEFHPRLDNYVEDWVSRYNEYDFFKHFRMTQSSVNILLDLLMQDSDFRVNGVHGKEMVEPLRRLLITLRYISSRRTYYDLSEIFSVSESTAFNVVETTIKSILKLHKTFIKWPTEVEAQQIAAEFEEACGIPGVIGAIDGSHVECKVQKDFTYDYTNRKYRTSIIIQAVCTYGRLLTHINIGFPGRAHDARVLQNSSIWAVTQSHGPAILFFNDNYHLLGDSAYPLKTWLIVPFKRTRNVNHMPQNRKDFNRQLSRGRVAIENTFGWLKGRWRRLKYIDSNSLEKISDFVEAACILHNFCLFQNDDLPQELVDQEENIPQPEPQAPPAVPDIVAVNKRTQLMQNVLNR